MRAFCDLAELAFDGLDFDAEDFERGDFADFAIAPILRYAARVRRTRSNREVSSRARTVAIVGSGSLASFLSFALHDAGYEITEIILRARAGTESKRRGGALASRVGAKAVAIDDAVLDASLLWLCVPDREIRSVAARLAERVGVATARRGGPIRSRVAFHSSGALLSDELAVLRAAGFAVASVHPLMTFVSGARPSLGGVPFALEGDAAATKIARRVVRDLRAESFLLPAGRKAAYHAWATMTSPLLVAYQVTLEDAARAAGLSREDARRMSLPIVLQTIENYVRLGPASSFSGPFMRGDSETVAKHLELLRTVPVTRAVYVALARAALKHLPIKKREELRRILE
jgi:predicted short-subunit dehydrogenase-like oxidoreductase (DUF2520 family)